jgi:Family of unknown function (DUF6491)
MAQRKFYKHMRLAALLCTPIILASCAAGDQGPTGEAALNPKQLALLEKNLAGKQAGEPVNCVSTLQNNDAIKVSDDIILYRVSSRLVYRNDLRSSCPGLARDTDIMVTRVTGSQICSGDIIHLVDRSSGIGGAACSYGKFTPYRSPPKS